MKYLKMLGLAAVAAMALMAVVGAGTASADEICTEGGTPCPAGKQISTIVASQVGTGTLETTGGTTLIDCNAGDIHIAVTSQGAKVDPVLGTVETLKFTECSGTVTTIKPGTMKGTASGTNGALTSVGAEVTTGILGTTCTYGSGAGTSLGTTSGTSLTVNTVVQRTAGGFLCPTEARWTASFKITNHSAVSWVNN